MTDEHMFVDEAKGVSCPKCHTEHRLQLIPQDNPYSFFIKWIFIHLLYITRSKLIKKTQTNITISNLFMPEWRNVYMYRTAGSGAKASQLFPLNAQFSPGHVITFIFVCIFLRGNLHNRCFCQD